MDLVKAVGVLGGLDAVLGSVAERTIRDHGKDGRLRPKTTGTNGEIDRLIEALMHPALESDTWHSWHPGREPGGIDPRRE